MKKKTVFDENMPVGEMKRVMDFLPPPKDILPARQTTKVTLLLDKDSVDFFRNQAKRNGAKYQRMMREVLREYAGHYENIVSFPPSPGR